MAAITGAGEVSKGADKLFVYGALMSVAERGRLLGREVSAERARLEGYERGRGEYFFVIRRDGAHVDGEIISGLGDGDFNVLDGFEDVPRLYLRERVMVINGRGEKIECWIYLPTGWEMRAR